MSAPASRPVHPCLLSIFDGNTGAEHATWAHLTPSTSKSQLPNLVTAQGSTIHVYSIDDATGKLLRRNTFSNLAGNVCFLAPLKTTKGPDSLVVGFSGYPRLSVVSLTRPDHKMSLAARPVLLMATTLVDFTQALLEHGLGSVTPLEQDLIATLEQKSSSMATLTVILGGGVAVAALTLRYVKEVGGWQANEPYLLPLTSLPNRTKKSLEEAAKSAGQGAAGATQQIVSHGFGDILSACFLTGYLEPTVVLLHSHSDPGRTWPGRLGRPNGEGGTKYGLTATAISVTVPHRRSAVLWSVEVPADAISLHSVGTTGCLVLSVNTVLEINNAGRIRNVLAVNGWARSSCPFSLLDQLHPNPSPLPKLSIELDGARLSFLKDYVALLSLRRGQLYILQRVGDVWNLLSVGQTLGAAGQVSNILALPFPAIPKYLWSTLVQDKVTAPQETLSMGLIFAGSRLGDSILLGYSLESGITLFGPSTNGKKPKLEDVGSMPVKMEMENVSATRIDSEYELVLQQEEEALYAPTDDGETVTEDADKTSDVIPPNKDEMEAVTSTSESGFEKRKRSRARLTHLTMVRSLIAMDTLVALGPIGPGCEGPISRPTILGPSTPGSPYETPPIPDSAHICPCGLGSSGSLALLTMPGRDDRTIMAEADCLNMRCLFSLPKLGVLLMGRNESDGKQGTSVLRVTQPSTTNFDVELSEVELSDWCKTSNKLSESAFHILDEMKILSVGELDNDSFVVVAQTRAGPESDELEHSAIVLREQKGQLTVVGNYQLVDKIDSAIISVTAMHVHEQKGSHTISFGCVWSSGNATVTAVGIKKTSFVTSFIECIGSSAIDTDEGDGDEALFYQNGRITAIDVFVAPKNVFSEASESSGSRSPASSEGHTDAEMEFGDEDAELYQEGGGESLSLYPIEVNEERSVPVESGPDQSSLGSFVAVSRQSGVLQVFELSALTKKTRSKKPPQPIWEAQGCGQGASVLGLSMPRDDQEIRHPRMHQIYASEIRFFFAGFNHADGTIPSLNRFCLGLETSSGDFHLYERNHDKDGYLTRVPLRLCSRKSQEQARHQTKLRRKRIIGDECKEEVFRPNALHTFHGISGQNGLFAALVRPLWIVAERGSVVALEHRSRHCAPAGGKPRPVTGFCQGVGAQSEKTQLNQSFVTLHERIGRVGSQRLTIFSGITSTFSKSNSFPGGGVCLEKILFGVTVHHIQLIDDLSISSGDHPLYAMLISRELELGQSNLDDDGMTPEERQRIKDEKEAELVKRQVEADLGGFDLEQEWVEEIERENCFEVDTEMGGAPPIYSRAYALWIVDASDNWNVVDSYQLDEVESGLTMQVMALTEVNEEPGSTVSVDPDTLVDTVFVTVGTGIVDKDGEDLGGKGRVLLFEVKRTRRGLTGPITIDLNLVYEKDILHGAVTSLSCLACEGRKRLIVGAGADVNVEQWGNDKLTQVGFFRANMQILDIMVFKNFLLLSDAYDSLYFLIWRESDKSLTLLAKDYEPIPVYAAGLLSRGGSMSLVCHDDRQNLQFFQYAPGDGAARGGNKLVCRADIHCGGQTVSLQNHTCRSSLLINSATPSSTLEALKQQDTFFGKADDDQRLAIHYGTTDGGFSSIIPLSEPVYWRLTALQSVMANALESDCALSQRAWRLYRRTSRRGGCRSHDRKKGVIDGDLVVQFADLPLVEQEDLASAIGSTVDLILDNLVELRCASMVL